MNDSHIGIFEFEILSTGYQVADEDYKRKLVAILSADVEGYSTLMDDNEEATVRTLTAYRSVIKDFTGKYRGRVVDAPGDNILAEFSSVVDAANCAVQIQRDLSQRNAELSYNRKMEDLFEIKDDISKKIVTELQVEITGEYNPIWIHYGLTASYLEINQINNAGEHFKEAVALSQQFNFIGWAMVMLRYNDKDLERLKRLFEPLRRMYADADIKTKQYVHEEIPAFKFEYPEGSQDRPFKNPGQIFLKRVPGGGGDFFSYVDDIPQGINIEDFGQQTADT